jgi:exodeoxyribonuclease VII small subunit
MKFEDAIVKLEDIVHKLEAGNLSLDEALNLFEKGMELSRFCSKKLEEAQSKIEMLIKEDDGKLITQPFKLPEEGNSSEKEE